MSECEEYLTSEQMKIIILGHLRVHEEEYQKFHNSDLLKDAKSFFSTGNFNSNIVDVIVSCAARALNINLYIYQQSTTGKVQVLKSLTHPQSKDVHLKFTHNNLVPGANHYEPITFRKNSAWESYFGEMSIPNNSPSPAHSSNPDMDECEVLDLSQKSSNAPVSVQIQNSPHSSSELSEKEKWNAEGMNDYFFPKHVFSSVEPEWVDHIPGNIDGKCMYKIRTDSRNYWKVTSDLRHFAMKTSNPRKFHGIRKTGYCQGDLFCPNSECTFVHTNSQSQEPNKTQWQKKKGSNMKTCYSCGSYAQSASCPGRKYVEFSFNDRIATVYHLGKHICHLKVNNARFNAMAHNTALNNPNCGPTEARRKDVKRRIDTHGIDDGFRAAEETQTRNVKAAKRNLDSNQNSNPNSFEAVAIYRQGLMKRDPFLIHRVNDNNFNEAPDYVFKSSREMGEIALKMDQYLPEYNALMGEEAYFDGAHKRCAGFKTLALFVYHPGMRKILRLASMEVRAENTLHISLFWKLFNQMLSQIKGHTTEFNPKAIMVDEAGANFCGVREAFGVEFCMQKVVSCQLHFKKDVIKHSNKIPECYRAEFRSVCYQMCCAATVAKYNELKALLDEFAGMFSNLRHWLDWWHARKYHVFTPFRRFGYSNVTFAEAGHSSGRRSTQLLLLEACKDDVASMVLQVSDMRQFFNQTGIPTGKGPTSLSRAEKSRREQVRLAKIWVQELDDNQAQEEEEQEARNPQEFVPSARCKHRPATRKTVEGQLKRKSGIKVPGGRKKKKNEFTAGLGTQIQLARDIAAKTSAGQQRPVQPHPCPDCKKGNINSFPQEVIPYNPARNKPQIVLFLGLNISRCRGCGHKINRSLYPSPRDMVFRMQATRKYRCPRTQRLMQTWGNVYFHLSFACLQEAAPGIKMEDLTLSEDTLVLLNEQHLQFLKNQGLLQYVIDKYN